MSTPSLCEREKVIQENITYFHGLENDYRIKSMKMQLEAISQRKGSKISQQVLEDILQKAVNVRHSEKCSDPFIGKGRKAKKIRAQVIGVCFQCGRNNCRNGWRWVTQGRLKIKCDQGCGISPLDEAPELEFINQGVDASHETKLKFTYCAMCRAPGCGSCSRFDEEKLELTADNFGNYSDNEPDKIV